MTDNPLPDETLTVVFTTNEPGLLPLAEIALDQQGIEHFTRHAARDSLVAGGESFRGTLISTPSEVLVRESDADTARRLLADLESSTPAAGTGPGASHTDLPEPAAPPAATVELVDTETGRRAGRITVDELAWLSRLLERESADDRDYYFDAATLDMLEQAGADARLMATLREALGKRDGVELRWDQPAG